MSVISICGSVGKNTGPIACDVKRGRPVGIVLGGAVFAPSAYATPATFQTNFVAKLKKATGASDKLYPFPEIQGNTDKTDANKEGTLGYGLKFILLQGKPAYEFDMIPGTTQEIAMRKFNNTQVPVYVFDDASNIWGVSDTSGNFSGATCLISVLGKGFDDGQNPKTTKVSISFVSAADFYDNAAFASTSFGIGDLVGLVDVVLSEKSAHTTNVFHIQGKIVTRQLGKLINIADYFLAGLSSASLWTLAKDTDGSSVTITSVAANSASDGWEFTMDTTAYTAATIGDKFRIALAAPSVLDAAGVTGIESPAYLVVTK
jgi:hypothetical protein